MSVQGPVTRTIAATDGLLREIAERYLSPGKVADYLGDVQGGFDPQIAIYLRPERWLSADLGPG